MDQAQGRQGSHAAAEGRVAGLEWIARVDEPGGVERVGFLGRGWVRRYGGHPVEIRLNGQLERRRLFVGGRERTGHRRRLLPARPAVDAIVNVCDRPDLPEVCRPVDVWRPHGEGPFGYTAATLLQDALLVERLLRTGGRVLVHCIAGVNRAPTLCAATLMLMEGIGASEALARVRQHRWMAFPDPWHWRALRELEGILREMRARGLGDPRSA